MVDNQLTSSAEGRDEDNTDFLAFMDFLQTVPKERRKANGCVNGDLKESTGQDDAVATANNSPLQPGKKPSNILLKNLAAEEPTLQSASNDEIAPSNSSMAAAIGRAGGRHVLLQSGSQRKSVQFVKANPPLEEVAAPDGPADRNGGGGTSQVNIFPLSSGDKSHSVPVRTASSTRGRRNAMRRRSSLGSMARIISSLDATSEEEKPTSEEENPTSEEEKPTSEEEKQTKGITLRLLKICCFLTIFILLAYACIALFVEFALDTGDMNNKENFETFDNNYKDIIEGTIPPTQLYYHELDSQLLLPKKQWSDINAKPDASCIDTFFENLNSAVAYTSPPFVKLVLTVMGLSQSEIVHRHLKELISSKQDVSTMYSRSNECLKSNAAIAEMACQIPVAFDKVDPDFLEYMVTGAVVLDALTEAMVADLSVVSEVLQVLVDQGESKKGYFDDITFSPERKDFFMHKYDGIVISLKGSLNSLATNTQRNDDDMMLQTNILEAVRLDIVNGNDANARVGIALAAGVGFNAFYDEHRMHWELGEDWVAAYLSWNLAFVMSISITPSILLIPSVACTAVKHNGRDFIHRRILSLATSFTFISDSNKIKAIDIDDSINPQTLTNIIGGLKAFMGIDMKRLSQLAGEANLNHVVLSNPSRGQVEEMFFNLCGNICHGLDQWPMSRTSPMDYIDDEDYPLYISIIVWATAILTGLGFEFAIYKVILNTGWTTELQKKWEFAQFVFPFFATISLGLAAHQNYLSLLFLVMGLFKFGFPEILLCIYSAIYLKGDHWSKAKYWLSGLGTILHHSSAILVISMLVNGAIKPDRFVMDPILILVVQHWFVMLKYIHEPAYIVIECILEVWFEWSLISQLEVYVYHSAWLLPTAALGMLVAHWFYLSSGFIGLIKHHHPKEEGRRQTIAIHEALNSNDEFQEERERAD